MKRLLFIILSLLSISFYGQDVVELRYTIFNFHHKVKGHGYHNAIITSAYVIGRDRKGTKRIEGKINSDSGTFIGKVIEYYKNGKIKSIKFYGKNPNKNYRGKIGVWQYFDKEGRLLKEEKYD